MLAKPPGQLDLGTLHILAAIADAGRLQAGELVAGRLTGDAFTGQFALDMADQRPVFAAEQDPTPGSARAMDRDHPAVTPHKFDRQRLIKIRARDVQVAIFALYPSAVLTDEAIEAVFLIGDAPGDATRILLDQPIVWRDIDGGWMAMPNYDSIIRPNEFPLMKLVVVVVAVISSAFILRPRGGDRNDVIS